MKRYIFGTIAVIIATASLAFTNKSTTTKPLSSHSFYYMAPGGTDYSQTAVQDKANWISNPGTVPTCSGTAKACRIEVNDSYTELNGSSIRVFKTSGNVAEIVAGEGSVPELNVPLEQSSTGLDGTTDRAQ
ncbi:MAG: hypothetical protein ABIN01_22410 [Ferruginibacter sp.]